MTNKFLQPGSGIKILERAENRHTLTPEAIARGKARVASGENIEQVAKDLIEEQALRVLGGPGSGNFGHAGRPGEVGGSAPASGGGVFTKGISTAPPVSKEIKQKAYDEVKAGGKFREVAEKYGMTQGQLAGFVYKVDQKKKALEEIIKKKVEQKEATPQPEPEPTPKQEEPKPKPQPPTFSPSIIPKGLPSIAEVVAKKKTEIAAMKETLWKDKVDIVPYGVNAPKGSQKEADQVTRTHLALKMMVDGRAKLREAGVEPPKVTFVLTKLPSNSYAAANGSVIKFNMTASQTADEITLRKFLKQDMDTGFHTYGDPSSVLVHELGHVLHRQHNTDHFLNLIPSYGKQIGKLATPASAAQVSGYAKFHKLEFVAETFEGLVAGKLYSDEVMRDYARLYGPDVPKNPFVKKAYAEVFPKP